MENLRKLHFDLTREKIKHAQKFEKSIPHPKERRAI